MKNITLITLLFTSAYFFNSCTERTAKKDTNNSHIQSEETIKSKLCSSKELIIKAQEYYDNKKYSKSLAMLAELEERYPDSEECKQGITIEGISNTSNIQAEKAVSTTVNKIEGKTKDEEKSQNSYNHVLAVEINSNNVDEKIIEERTCKTYISLDDDYIVVSGYTTKKTYFEIISTGNVMGSKYYDVKTKLKESKFLFDTEDNSVVWQQTKHDNSGLQIYFTNK
ncbi:outer membrane protein assembly factor BamD [Labilibacter marinus]|uniref:hypothetical protein n=1 Tax=Labilibacter marinus TaxID=1477105 RepID=UPI00082D78FB|nr:hypothetical protein [Labilibacter marinus]